jgi:hypothetical protein
MHPDPFRPGLADDMDSASRREFFGPGGRRRAATEPPPIIAMHGDGLDTPLMPDATSDSPLNAHHGHSRRRPISDRLATYGEHLNDE